MPRVSQFDGVEVYFYYSDHLPPHFHAFHGGDEALIEWDPPRVYAGSLPSKALKKALDWAGLHRAERDDAWQRARNSQPLVAIPSGT